MALQRNEQSHQDQFHALKQDYEAKRIAIDAKMAKQVNEIENLKGLIDDLERQVLALKAENRELKDQIEKLE